MKRKIKWGIIGLGKIAKKFASDLFLVESATPFAVASRSIEKAKIFAQEMGFQKYYGTYEELVLDKEIDVIYIATPHVFHFDNTMLCLKNRKAVLCEKPLGMNTDQVKLMINEAKRNKVFLMEGLWTRFIPITEKLMELMEKKVIGEILSIKANFGFKANRNENQRLFKKELGGGSLLDVGIYPIYLSLLLLGVPIDKKAKAKMTNEKIDTSCSMLLKFKNGAIAQLESSIEANTSTEALIYGSLGTIKLHYRFHQSEKMSIERDGKIEIFEIPYLGIGYVHEIEEVNKNLFAGKTESSKHSLKTSLALINVLDQVRNKIGLTY